MCTLNLNSFQSAFIDRLVLKKCLNPSQNITDTILSSLCSDRYQENVE